MQKYATYQFDRSTFIVFDQKEQQEFCVCQDYDGYEDAELRAKEIAVALNYVNKNAREIFFATLQ